jgi:hypothetical protein
MNAILITVLLAYALPMPTAPSLGGASVTQQPHQAQESNPPSQTQPDTTDTTKDQSEQRQSPSQNAPAPAQEPQQTAPEKPEAGTTPQAPAAPPESAAGSGNAPSSSTTPRKEKKAAKRSPKRKKRIIRNGGAAEPTSQLAPAMPQDQAKRSRQSTDQLLSSSQENLKRASARTLNSNQQATVEQIKVFIEQANAALKVGDFQRGHNLAQKAHALSEDLLKQ